MYVALINIDVVYYLRNFTRRFDKHMWVIAVYSFTPAHFLNLSIYFDNFRRRCQ